MSNALGIVVETDNLSSVVDATGDRGSTVRENVSARRLSFRQVRKLTAKLE
ncbi:MAG: hypothetical protein AAGG53_17810 [Cyanobacteria bacterium P01_H01_bin.152]